MRDKNDIRYVEIGLERDKEATKQCLIWGKVLIAIVAIVCFSVIVVMYAGCQCK